MLEREREREERERASRGEAERERERQTDRQRDRESEAGSVLAVVSPMWGSNPQTMGSWPELKPRVGRLPD